MYVCVCVCMCTVSPMEKLVQVFPIYSKCARNELVMYLSRVHSDGLHPFALAVLDSLLTTLEGFEKNMMTFLISYILATKQRLMAQFPQYIKESGKSISELK